MTPVGRPVRVVVAGFVLQLAVLAVLLFGAPALHDAGLIEPDVGLGVALGSVVGLALTLLAGALALPFVAAQLLGRAVRLSGWYALAAGGGIALSVLAIAITWFTPLLLLYPAALVLAGLLTLRARGPAANGTTA